LARAASSSTRDATTVIGLRDRALIGLVVYSFARIGAAIGVRLEYVYTPNRRLWVRLHEEAGERHCIASCGLASDPKGPLVRTISRSSIAGTSLPRHSGAVQERLPAV
jgi:integrase